MLYLVGIKFDYKLIVSITFNGSVNYFPSGNAL